MAPVACHFEHFASTIRSKFSLGLMLFFAIVAFSHKAYSWEYSEHVYISAQSFEKACDLIRKDYPKLARDDPRFERMCATQGPYSYAAICQGHMAALAGDFVENPEALVDDANGRYLVNRNLDCRGLDKYINSGALPTESNTEFPFPQNKREQKTFRLYKRSLFQFIDYSTLVASNEAHFQPKSKDEARKVLLELHGRTPRPRSIAELFARHGFALHYIQDSYSAGHNGLERHRYRQDFDNAFHDDLNATGNYLSVDGKSWHTYGDRRLNDRTIYIRFKNNEKETVGKTLTRTCQELSLGCDRSPIIDDYLEVIESLLEDQPRTHRFALSLDSRKGLLCNFVDSCEKAEFQILLDADPDPDIGNCVEVREATFDRFECRSSLHHLLEQATRSSRAFILMVLDFPRPSDEIVVEEILRKMPNEYLPLRTTKYTFGSINSDPTILAYNRSSIGNKEGLFTDYFEWGYAITNNIDTVGLLNSKSLVLSLRRPLGPLFTLPDLDDGAPLRFQLGWQLVNSEGHMLDGVELSSYSPSWRTPRKVAGLSVKAIGGVDNIWRGSNKRNWYAGIGLSGDLHLGKRIVYFDFAPLWHWGAALGEEKSVQLNLGVRFVTVDITGFLTEK